MNDKRDNFKKKFAFNLLGRAIIIACTLICCLFGFQYYGKAGGYLGIMAGMFAGLLIMTLLEDRASVRAKAKQTGHGLRKRDHAQADNLPAYDDPSYASSNDRPGPRP